MVKLGHVSLDGTKMKANAASKHKAQALPLVQQIKANTGSLPKEASADAGYYSAQAVEELYALGVDPFIPPDKTRHGAVLPPAPRGRTAFPR